MCLHLKVEENSLVINEPINTKDLISGFEDCDEV